MWDAQRSESQSTNSFTGGGRAPSVGKSVDNSDEEPDTGTRDSLSEEGEGSTREEINKLWRTERISDLSLEERRSDRPRWQEIFG